MVIIVRAVTKSGGKATKQETSALMNIRGIYIQLLKKMDIRRHIRLLVCDDWTYHTHLKFHRNSVAHYDPGGVVNGRNVPETIFVHGRALRAFNIEQVIMHELVHAKLRWREGKPNEHGPGFRELARKYGLKGGY